MSSVLKYWKSTGWILCVLYVSFVPKDNFSPFLFFFEHQDKVVHIVMYAGVSFFILHDIRKQISAYYRTLLLVFFVVVLFSALIEDLQPVLSNRSQDLMDIVANVIGDFIGVLLFVFFNKRKARKLS